jgi:hypothetical protein
MRAAIDRSELDLETLVWTRGRAFPLSRLESRLRCPCCGSRYVVVLYEPPRRDIKSRP